ncbi:ABC transporter permease [Metamycoplasma hominis]|uniref:ABC transporter permease n=1 Tax=Metamycoplasma hominis TaxID=2098 RepID=UPI003CEA6581
MRRLFKEVFKSLARNKVTLICLTILIFLTTFLFTLLNDVTTSYSSTINSYEKVSKLHDATVDFDVNPSGVIPKSGYNQIGSDNQSIVDKPVVFESSNNGSDISYSIDLPKDQRNYVGLKNTFNNLNYDNENHFINTYDLLNLLYSSKESISDVDVEILKSNPDFSKIRNFSFSGHDREFKLYVKDNKGNIKPLTKRYNLTKNDDITFLNEVRLKNIASIAYGPRGSLNDQKVVDYLYNPSPLFLNVKTKQASFDTKDYEAWKNSGSLHTIDGKDVMKMLGFKEISENHYEFDASLYNKNSDLKIENSDFTSQKSKFINEDFNISRTFKLQNFLSNKSIEKDVNEFTKLAANKIYQIPNEWIKSTEVLTTYNWYRFALNWNEKSDEYSSNWKGSYFKYIAKLKESDPNVYKNIQYFSYWNKTIKTIYKLNSSSLKQEKTTTLPIEQKDLLQTFKNSWNGGFNNSKIPAIKENISKEHRWNIQQIEYSKSGDKLITEDQFKAISDPNNLKKYQEFIRKGSVSYARNALVNEIKNNVGEENLGIRQTLTVESVDEKTTKKNVFHFVNAGDGSQKIYGVKNNVGKLYNETLNPTLLNSSVSDKNVNEFILKPDPNDPMIKKIPPVYTKQIIKYIFEQWTPSINYFNADIRFLKYYDFLPNTKIPYEIDGKILMLTVANDEPKTVGSSIVGAVARISDEKYILLKYSTIDGFSDKKVWNRVDVNGKAYLTSQELYEYMIRNNYSIRGEIGPNGWAVADKEFKNSFSLPISFGAINNNLTNEIIQNKTINGLVNVIRDALFNSEIINMFNKDDLLRIMDAAKQSVVDNDFHTLLNIGKVNGTILQKVLLDILKYIIRPVDRSNSNNLNINNVNVNAFVQNVFIGIINYLEKMYMNSGTNDNERNQYLMQQVYNISKLLNLDNLYLIPSLKLSLFDIINLVKNKSTIFEVLRNVIRSVDFEKFSLIIQDWFEKHPYKPFTSVDDTYWILSSERILISFLKSIDVYKLKSTLSELIDNIDFNGFLNPESPNSLYSKWINANREANNFIDQQTKDGIKEFFRKLNGATKAGQEYDNFKQGLKNIIANFDLDRFIQILEQLVKHEHYPIVANNKIYKDFNTESLTSSDYLTSFFGAISSNLDGKINSGKISQIQESVIQMFNFSNKTKRILGKLNITIPDYDNNKITLFDLINMSKFSFPQSQKQTNVLTNIPINPFDVDDIKKILLKAKDAKINNKKLKLTQNEFDVLKNNVLVTKDEFNDLDLIISKLTKYHEYIDKLVTSNSLYKQSGINSAVELNDLKSYLDVAYYSASFNNVAPEHAKDLEILKTIHSLIKDNLAKLMLNNDPQNVASNVLSLYSLWIKLAYQLSQIADIQENIVIDPTTNKRIIERKVTKYLDYKQIKEILLGLYNIGISKEIKDIVLNYKKVINPIPSLGILGSDDDYSAKLFKMPFAHAHTAKATKQIMDLMNNSAVFKNLFDQLSKNHVSNKGIEAIKEILKNNMNEITYNFGYMASSNQMPTHYLQALKLFLQSFINVNDQNQKIKPLINDEYTFSLVYKDAIAASKTASIISLLNVPRNILNGFNILSFPQILLYYVLSPNPDSGNIAYIIKKLLSNIDETNATMLKKQIEGATQKFNFVENVVTSKSDSRIDLDISKFNYMFNHLLKTPDNKDISFFGINITKTVKEVFSKIIEPSTVYNLIAYSEAASYLAKVNYGYLNKNKKEVYNGDISKYLNNPFEMQQFIASLDDKYKIKVNTQEYLITGIDSTADYLYPVINEENLQVDTKTQSVVYVNSRGFDRIRSAYPTFALKSYALVKSPVDKKGKYLAGKDPKNLKKELQRIVSSISPNSKNKVFLKDEPDAINPERYIRVKTIRTLVTSIKNATLYLITILAILVILIVYFIIKRYIEARNKVVGILRAQGYKTSEIALSFCAFGWIPTIVGGIFGYIVGFALQKPAMSILSSYWTLENNIIPFNILLILAVVIIPLIVVSLVIYIITRVIVRNKPTELMSGLTEVSVGNFAQRVSAMFRKMPVKARFIASMALNNFWKMFSLFLAFSTTSLISMFFLSSNNVFNKTISKTYKNRLYKYKLNLESPTTEGGPYVTYNQNDINDLLYVPNDLAGDSSTNGSQLDYDNPNFLRPGASFNTDVIQRKFAPTVITKSSLDLLMDLSVELSPWDITYANMPETQRARVNQIFNRVSSMMQSTQNLINLRRLKNGGDYRIIDEEDVKDPTKIIAVKDIKKFFDDYNAKRPEDLSNRTSYFLFSAGNYSEAASGNRKQFRFVEWVAEDEIYLKPAKVSTAKFRQEYRNFLVNAYRKINGIDFYVSFGGVYWNDTTNEKYTYASVTLNGKETKIYGYYNDSKFMRLQDSRGNNLTKLLQDYNYNFDSNDPIPVVVNEVTARSYRLKVNSVFDAKILNHVDRFAYQALMQKSPRVDYKFKVIGISDTYINSEISTRKDILDHILGYDTLSKRLKDARKYELQKAISLHPDLKDEYIKKFNKKYDAFNGILSIDKVPVQTIDTLTTYSATGFWGAASSYDVAEANDNSAWDFFKRMFISNPKLKYISVYEHNIQSYNEAHPQVKLDYKTQLKKLLGNLNDENIQEIIDSDSPLESYKILVRETLTKFYGTQASSIYGKNIMYGASFDVNSKDIEAGFIEGISSTVNTILLAFIIISLIISIVILIVITNIMIASNGRSIATFSILGYTNKEKILLFFFNFVPAIVFACLLMIPATLAIIAIFNSFMMVTSQIVLPLVLHISTVILSALICLAVFIATSIATWNSLNKIKAVDALKGK